MGAGKKKALSFKFILLLLSFPTLSLWARAGEPTLESNVSLFLGEQGLLDTVNLQGPTRKGSSIRAVPVLFDADGTPTLLSRILGRPLDWRETKGTFSLFDRLWHRGRWKSFRSTLRPSLHLIVFREEDADGHYRYLFLLHFDKYVPSTRHLWETVKHLTMEVIPNTFLGKATSQNAVKGALERQHGPE